MKRLTLALAILVVACGPGATERPTTGVPAATTVPDATSIPATITMLPATTMPDTTTTPTLADVEAWTRCDNPDGFSLAYPPSWAVNSGEVLPSCSLFDPEEFTVPEATDARVAAIWAQVDPIPFHEAAVPDPDTETSRAATVIDGFQAARVEQVSDGEGLYPEGTRLTIYMIDLSPGVDEGPGTLFVDTLDLPGFEYERNVAVLDRMARTVTVTAGPDAPPSLVARYEGGGGVVVVEARPQNGQVCLVIPPEGEPTCLPPPDQEGLETTSLVLLGERTVLAGLAGQNVFRVEAHQTDGSVIGFLPAPIPDTDMRGWGFTFGPDEVDRLMWYAIDGRELGSIEP